MTSDQQAIEKYRKPSPAQVAAAVRSTYLSEGEWWVMRDGQECKFRLTFQRRGVPRAGENRAIQINNLGRRCPTKDLHVNNNPRSDHGPNLAPPVLFTAWSCVAKAWRRLLRRSEQHFGRVNLMTLEPFLEHSPKILITRSITKARSSFDHAFQIMRDCVRPVCHAPSLLGLQIWPIFSLPAFSKRVEYHCRGKKCGEEDNVA